MEDIEKQFTRKIVIRLALRRFFSYAVIWLFAWGLVSFVLRAVAGIPAIVVWAGFAGLLPILLAAIFIEVRDRPDRSGICAFLDRYNRLGGLLMAANETDVSEWRHLKGVVRCPSVTWHGYREWTMFALSILFVGACAFIPAHFAGSDPKARLEIDETLTELENKIEVLEQMNLIDPDKADELEAELARIGENALGEDPAGAWEALDHLENGIRAAAEDFTENVASKIEDLNQAQRLAGILGEMSDLRPDVREESMRELMDALRKANDMGDLTEHLDPDIQKAMADGKPLSKEQLEKLRSGLRESKNDMVRKQTQLSQCRLADAETCENAAEKAKKGDEALASFLREKEKDLTASEISDYCKLPGKGGVSRGRADAAMTWKDETDENGALFREETLPVSAIPEDISLVGFSKTAPETNETNAAVRPGALAGAATGNGSAIVRRTLPRHRGAVKRYFERGE